MMDYYVLVGTGKTPLALIRVGPDYYPIERWQPESNTWFEAPWHLDSIVGADRWRTHKISEEDAQAAQDGNPFGMVDMSQEAIASRNARWAKPVPSMEEM